MPWNDECGHGHKLSFAKGEDGWTIPSSPKCNLCRPGDLLPYQEFNGMHIGKPFCAVLSGGQDSTTCLAYALKHIGRNDKSFAVFFNYGQKHLKQEVLAATKVAKHFSIPLYNLDVPTLSQIGDSGLVDSKQTVDQVDPRNGLPTSFTPGRNLMFLTAAAAYAYKHKHDPIQLVTGVCQTDFSGYPDCRREFIDSFERTMRFAIGGLQVTVVTPLMFKTKAESVLMMRELGEFDILAQTHTCYNGIAGGCQKCPACVLRTKGFVEAGCVDPAIIQNAPVEIKVSK